MIGLMPSVPVLSLTLRLGPLAGCEAGVLGTDESSVLSKAWLTTDRNPKVGCVWSVKSSVLAEVGGPLGVISLSLLGKEY